MTAVCANRAPSSPTEEIVVIKRNPQGQEIWRYTGQVLQRLDNTLIIEAYFNREDMPFHGLILSKGDRFVETFHTDRWYNIFEMHDRSDDHLKGWYCNVCTPAEINPGQVAYNDLALDLLVYQDGKQLVLDQDEFAELSLPPGQREQALEALAQLRQHFQAYQGKRF